DTTIYATYTGGLDLGGHGNGQARKSGDADTLKLFLYSDDGTNMKSGTGQDVCAPCLFTLDETQRKLSIRVDDLIVAKGGFPAGGGGAASLIVTGFAVIVVGGDSPDAVNLQAFVVNSHTSAFDLSVFGFEPQPILAAP